GREDLGGAVLLQGQRLAEIRAVFVGVGAAIVVVVVEAGALVGGEGVDRDFGDGFLADVVLHRLGRDDGAFTHEQRDVAPAGGVHCQGNGLAAGVGLAGEPVEPGAGGQVDVFFGLALLHYRRDQQVIAEQPAVDVVGDLRIVRPVEQQRTHQADAVDVAGVLVAVDVGDQRVAQADRRGGGFLGDGAV